jgi:hypothetical protein
LLAHLDRNRAAAESGHGGRRRISVTFSVFGSILTMTVCIGWPG